LVEEIVISHLMKIIFDDDLMDKLADALLEHLHKENDTLPILQKQFAETQKSIDNMLNAIQQGIFTISTKERLEALEREKSELSVQIMKEELSRPNLTKEQILFWIHKFRKLNPKKLEHRRRLINSFLNSVYLLDDKIIIDCNYKDGTETITFEEIENSALGSDLTSLAAPRRSKVRFASTFLCKKVIRPLPCFSSFTKSHARLTCSVVNALTTARCRHQLFVSFILTRYEHSDQTVEIRTLYQSVEGSDFYYILTIQILIVFIGSITAAGGKEKSFAF